MSKYTNFNIHDMQDSGHTLYTVNFHENQYQCIIIKPFVDNNDNFEEYGGFNPPTSLDTHLYELVKNKINDPYKQCILHENIPI